MAGRSRRGERPLREPTRRARNPGGRAALPVLVSGGDGRAPATHRERDALEPLPRLRRGQARAARLLPQLQRGVLGSTTLVALNELSRPSAMKTPDRTRHVMWSPRLCGVRSIAEARWRCWVALRRLRIMSTTAAGCG